MSHHSAPGGDCLVCYEELSDTLFFEWQTSKDGPWKVCTNCCSVCIESMRQSQWSSYISQLKNASCAKELDRLLDSLPYYIKDKNILPCEEGEQVINLWYSLGGGKGRVVSGKLEGALEGDAWTAFKVELSKFKVTAPSAEGKEEEH